MSDKDWRKSIDTPCSVCGKQTELVHGGYWGVRKCVSCGHRMHSGAIAEHAADRLQARVRELKEALRTFKDAADSLPEKWHHTDGLLRSIAYRALEGLPTSESLEQIVRDLQAENARLREALKPFARIGSNKRLSCESSDNAMMFTLASTKRNVHHVYRLVVSDFRRAAAAIDSTATN